MMSGKLDKSPQKIRTMFEAIAPWYDFLNHTLSLGIDRSWRRRAAKILICSDQPDGGVLDVCCGTGDLSFALRRRFEKGAPDRDADFFGLDFSRKMIDLARKKAGQIKSGAAFDFQVGDALNLPFESESFTLVANAFGLRNVGDTDRGIAEMIRVCRPGGTIAVLEFSMPTCPLFGIPYRFYFRRVLPRIGQFFSRSKDDAYRYLPDSVLEFDDAKRLAERMNRHGLTDIRTVPMTFGVAALTYGKKPSSNV